MFFLGGASIIKRNIHFAKHLHFFDIFFRQWWTMQRCDLNAKISKVECDEELSKKNLFLYCKEIFFETWHSPEKSLVMGPYFSWAPKQNNVTGFVCPEPNVYTRKYAGKVLCLKSWLCLRSRAPYLGGLASSPYFRLAGCFFPAREHPERLEWSNYFPT